ncbi:MAG: SUMF1/EgtB/PvdO family nonheme iron enzyme [Hydrogenophaga sp.]|uniref:formylglycine-generating enzyme family protein n=1 Tax=Hydrogenophaga sp. TaxID=1904254 RepID=UPI002AB87B16|nr:SUMF1/EgtB/PvdO family nonheme iron enzyme [Hydrogenophaga sp.]MDZ4189423.1 SUMF1/EgtB/PvdO family nonheme iron enzyme [Hydrogenophaga sp.]
MRLPIEAQCERAARAHSLTAPGVRQFPWGSDDVVTAHLNENLGASDLHHASPVGLFAPNPLGLCDLSGSVLVWQSNLYTPDSSGQDKVWVTDAVKLKTHDDFDQCDRPALLGGAWRYPAVSARVVSLHASPRHRAQRCGVSSGVIPCRIEI